MSPLTAPLLPLFWWEKATLPAAEICRGWVAHQHLTLLTLAAFFPLGLIFYYIFQSPMACLLALPFARMLALDLTTFTLPNIYTIPLAAAGLAFVITTHAWPNAIAASCMLACGYAMARFIPKAGIGGGDIKLMVAMFLWLAPQDASFAIALGCFLWLPVAFVFPKRAHPFGVPLILGWLTFSFLFMSLGLRYATFFPI